ncbi:MAG: hypothetical protein ISN28_10970 [Ectothiorhodospiraceae bacterium AqS1]|nr:hypothetical protein [Ectothiorhodospiraceae bacterium AqS1]
MAILLISRLFAASGLLEMIEKRAFAEALGAHTTPTIPTIEISTDTGATAA